MGRERNCLQGSLDNFRFVDCGDRAWGLANSTAQRSFQIDHFPRRFVGAGFEAGSLDWRSFELFVGRHPSVGGALLPAICTPSTTESEIFEVNRRMARNASSFPGIT